MAPGHTECRGALHAPVHERIRPIALDVTDAAQLAAAAAAKDIGPLSGLINNAGVTFSGPIEHLPLDRLREQLEINVVGVPAVSQAFLPAIRAGHGARRTDAELTPQAVGRTGRGRRSRRTRSPRYRRAPWAR
ncbi:SDR family NAD(P)-dependent oxidoreductase [Amycolatopsis sp.]|uniref:SDR family NAD(P)-dependent oxidoreductase n=1 Tax=Amycolatopsis sp. TaxID=37632 RepID=UPI00262E791E|nr:SDR family NAD(P)-dependent oxidoreductase [Amycolatopsis sp.]